MNIHQLQSASGKPYEIGVLTRGEYQYPDRPYCFDYVPAELDGHLHIKTHGNDKLTPEDQECFAFHADVSVEAYVLFADKFENLPRWLETYERRRMNVTRTDSRSDNLKGYFSLYKKVFPAGRVVCYGCSPRRMLEQEWYGASLGANYCMYTVCVKPH